MTRFAKLLTTFNINTGFTREQLTQRSNINVVIVSLDGKKYMPGSLAHCLIEKSWVN